MNDKGGQKNMKKTYKIMLIVTALYAVIGFGLMAAKARESQVPKKILFTYTEENADENHNCLVITDAALELK